MTSFGKISGLSWNDRDMSQNCPNQQPLDYGRIQKAAFELLVEVFIAYTPRLVWNDFNLVLSTADMSGMTLNYAEQEGLGDPE